jgi:hypothetical protein
MTALRVLGLLRATVFFDDADAYMKYVAVEQSRSSPPVRWNALLADADDWPPSRAAAIRLAAHHAGAAISVDVPALVAMLDDGAATAYASIYGTPSPDSSTAAP